MTLPLTDLQFSEVNVELSKSPTALIALDDADVRSLAGAGFATPGTTIAFSDLLGKSSSGSQLDFYPGTVFETDGPGSQNGSWNNMNNIKAAAGNASHGTNNQSSGTDSSWTNYLIGHNYGFSVPAGKTLTNLTVKVNCRWAIEPSLNLQALQLMNNTTPIGSVKGPQALTSSYVTYTFSGNNAYWGTTLTDAVVNASTFGVRTIYYNGTFNNDPRVDVAWYTVSVSW